MSKQAVDVLTRWIAESVRPVPEHAIGREATRLAAEFAAYAADAGIDTDRLEVEIGQEIVTRMQDALEAAAAAEADAEHEPGD